MLEVVIYNLWGLPWVFFYFYASFFEAKRTQDFETWPPVLDLQNFTQILPTLLLECIVANE